MFFLNNVSINYLTIIYLFVLVNWLLYEYIKLSYCVILYILVMLTYQTTNILITYSNVYINFSNKSLINGILLVHPILNYLAVFISLILFRLNKIKSLQFILINNNKTFFLIIFTSIILGSFWAQQELNWGGWWNWDLVELIPCLYVILSIWLLHGFKYNIINILIVSNTQVYFYILLYIVIVRLDIFNSIHTFVNNTRLAKYHLIVFINIMLFYHTFVYLNFRHNYIINFNCNKLKKHFIIVYNIILWLFIFITYNCIFITGFSVQELGYFNILIRSVWVVYYYVINLIFLNKYLPLYNIYIILLFNVYFIWVFNFFNFWKNIIHYVFSFLILSSLFYEILNLITVDIIVNINLYVTNTLYICIDSNNNYINTVKLYLFSFNILNNYIYDQIDVNNIVTFFNFFFVYLFDTYKLIVYNSNLLVIITIMFNIYWFYIYIFIKYKLYHL